MAKRLQVILQDPEYREIQRAARARHMTIAEWVRQALTAARRYEPLGETGKKLDMIREAAREEFPTADIDTMLAEIDSSLQEILHRYTAIDRRDAIQPAYDVLLAIVDEVLPIDRAAAERAKDIVMGRCRLSARDALHIAVMEQNGIGRILSFDSGFDGLPGITRLR
jgi:predicted nucleic acid-binding protein